MHYDNVFEDLTSQQWLELNAKLQQKKNEVRKKLKERGILPKGGTNKFDNYKYFSESQYKQLFTELFSECGLELTPTEVDYIPFEGTEKQANGRIAKIAFQLSDVDTGFFETSVISGEGIDKGDKAGYKAYTGAVKYYLADTFMVATGDDAEKESPEIKAAPKEYASETEQKTLADLCDKLKIDRVALAKSVGWKSGKLTKEQHGLCLIKIKEMQDEKRI